MKQRGDSVCHCLALNVRTYCMLYVLVLIFVVHREWVNLCLALGSMNILTVPTAICCCLSFFFHRFGEERMLNALNVNVNVFVFV